MDLKWVQVAILTATKQKCKQEIEGNTQDRLGNPKFYLRFTLLNGWQRYAALEVKHSKGSIANRQHALETAL